MRHRIAIRTLPTLILALAQCGSPGSDGNSDGAPALTDAARLPDLAARPIDDLAFAPDLATQPIGPVAFPLVISANHRYLQDQNGVPVPILGDAGWEVPKNLASADRLAYVNDRLSRGFNSILIEAIEHKFTVVKPPKDLAGSLPFDARLDGTVYAGSPNGTNSPGGTYGQFPADPYSDIAKQSPDFSSPDLAYFAVLDDFIALCEQKGILVFLFPGYVGYAGGDEGWMAEMVANDAVAGAGGFKGQSFADDGKSRLWNYGAWIADHYKEASNIVWVDGGDYGNNANNGGVFTQQQMNAVDDLLAGTKSVAGQKSVMHTAHWSRRSLSSDLSLNAGAFDLEAVYTDENAAFYGRNGYAHQPAAPAFELEDYYEGNSTEPDRRFQWWSFLSEIEGYFFGNETVWRCDTGWVAALSAQGSQDMARLNAFVISKPWHALVPSGLDGMKTLVTAGGSAPQNADYVAAAATVDGRTLIAYVPPAHSGTITIDMTALSGPANARWFNPATAAYTDIAKAIPNSGTYVFTPPGDNGSGFSDWVLTIEL